MEPAPKQDSHVAPVLKQTSVDSPGLGAGVGVDGLELPEHWLAEEPKAGSQQ
jgi:hypothetical protein